MSMTEAEEEFVTIVPVGESSLNKKENPNIDKETFVTVLSVGDMIGGGGAAEVHVRRPKGARLGLGLKFEGGAAASEKVKRLLVQSCAPESPAACARAPWGGLIPGDDILAIDGIPVTELTRIDCVRKLKDSEELLKLLVKHFNNQTSNEDNLSHSIDVDISNIADLKANSKLPPPVPPRKLCKKSSFKDKKITAISEIPGRDTLNNESDVSVLRKLSDSNGVLVNYQTNLSRKSSLDSNTQKVPLCPTRKLVSEERRLARRLSDGETAPPEAEVYIDLFRREYEHSFMIGEAESDDTSSSISTVVDRLSSLASSVENSIPSTPILHQKGIDIHSLLNSIENLDTEFFADISATTCRELLCNKLSQDLQKKSYNKNVSKPIENDKNIKNADLNNTECNTNDNVSHLPLKKDINKVNRDIVDINSDSNNNYSAIVKNITSINIESTHENVDSLDGIVDEDNINDLKFPNKQKCAIEPPMPLPRNIHRNLVSLSVSTPLQGAVTKEADDIFSPTKLNCIENWLQGSFPFKAPLSEVKDNDSNYKPEVLPRLIDFVPKSQVNCGRDALVSTKEIKDDPTNLKKRFADTDPFIIDRPLLREDGSGDSLDTIGEIDEADASSHDAIELKKQEIWRKPISDTFIKDTKSTTATRFHDKITEEAETPPSCPRQPPDGDEAPPIPTEVPPTQINKRWLPSSTLPKTTRKSFSRSQDARSECSVKDKIAMFSNKKSTSIEKLDKCFSKYPAPMHRPEIQNNHIIIPSNKLDKRFAQSTDSLDTVTKRYSLDNREKRPEVVGGTGFKDTYKSPYKSIEKSEFDKSLWIDKDPKEFLSRNTSRKSSYLRSESSESHKSTLDYLIEQRKKSMSKLRTLMIPDSKPICDLPEIKVQENKLDDFKFKKQMQSSYPQEKNNITSAKITSWTTAAPNIVPKYSPAFKRKSLQLLSAAPLSKEYESKYENSKINDNKVESKKIGNDIKSRAPSKPPRTSLENKKSYFSHMLNPRISYTNNQLTSNYSLNGKVSSDMSIHKSGHKGDIIDSDNDSAVSSTQSSYRSSPSSPSLRNIDSVESDSSHCSLRSSDHLDNSTIIDSKHKDIINTGKTFIEYKKRSITRSLSSETNTSIASSGGSVLTSGSQASCSSIESCVPETYRQKMSKNKSIEAINRRNILASAKCRSGRDLKINSPVIESKFTHEQESLDTSHITKTPEKISTLLVAVTKSDSCRRVRPKSIHETDSDSDSERINQRKHDFKTTRQRKAFYKHDQNRNDKPMDTVAESEIVLVSKGSTNADRANMRNGLQNISQSNANKNKIETKDAKENIPSNVCSYNANHNGNSTKTGIADRAKLKKTNKENAVPDMSNCGSRIFQTEVEKIVTRNSEEADNKVNSVLPPACDLGSTGTVVRLERGSGAGVGLILAGGVDCEAKHVTIHKILKGGPAEKDGSLSKGDRILSINSKCMEGLTHSESVAILKEPRNEVVLVVERSLEDTTVKTMNEAEIKPSLVSSTVSSNVLHVELVKSGAGAGLGLGLEGGKDSPNGDVPLLIKKLFTGGAAAKTGLIEVGAILDAVNGISVRNMTRTEAWNLLKSIPAGPVTLSIKPPVK